MKWLIASDIHGSAYYCELLLRVFKQERAERLLLLGDVLYHGPRNDLPKDYSPKSVISMLNGIKNDIISVRGNCDTEVDQMVLEFPILSDSAVICEKNTMIFATHGHIFNNDRLPPLHKGDILLHGHTHIPKCEKHDDYVYINPGSVSIPKEGSEHGYITLENGLFQWKTFGGDAYMQYEIV